MAQKAQSLPSFPLISIGWTLWEDRGQRPQDSTHNKTISFSKSAVQKSREGRRVKLEEQTGNHCACNFRLTNQFFLQSLIIQRDRNHHLKWTLLMTQDRYPLSICCPGLLGLSSVSSIQSVLNFPESSLVSDHPIKALTLSQNTQLPK